MQASSHHFHIQTVAVGFRQSVRKEQGGNEGQKSRIVPSHGVVCSRLLILTTRVSCVCDLLLHVYMLQFPVRLAISIEFTLSREEMGRFKSLDLTP